MPITTEHARLTARQIVANAIARGLIAHGDPPARTPSARLRGKRKRLAQSPSGSPPTPTRQR